MEWTADEVLKIQKIMRETNALSLNALIENMDSEHSDSTEVTELLVIDQVSVEDELLSNEGKDYLRSFVDKLPPREQYVIKQRFGLEDGIPKTLNEVGKQCNITRERARQVEANALRRLRDFVRRKKLSADDFR